MNSLAVLTLFADRNTDVVALYVGLVTIEEVAAAKMATSVTGGDASPVLARAA